MVKLNPLQLELLEAITRQQTMVAVRAGWGSGKTSALVFALAWVSNMRPGTSSLLITDTAQRYRTVLQPEIEKWLGPLGWTWNQTQGIWSDPATGSSVWCRSYFRPGTRDASHNPLEGINATSGVALIDEAQTMTQEVAFKALGRLRSGPSPMLVMCGLPVMGAWWVELAEDAGCTPLLHTSYSNRENLSEEWFKATEQLPPEERAAMIMNQPAPPSGLVYSEFSEAENIVQGWQYRESMTARIAVDWGFRKPSVLIIAHDEELDADIICAELNPKEVSLQELCRMILSIAWPRAHRASAPGPRIWLDSGCGDKAGAARSDRTAQSTFRELRYPPPHGLGLKLRWSTSPVKTDIMNGVQRLKRAIWERKYRITQEVWDAGRNAPGNSLRKAISGYAWDKKKEQPIKSGIEDPLDALRYDLICWRWDDGQALERRAAGAPARAHLTAGQRKPWETGGSF